MAGCIPARSPGWGATADQGPVESRPSHLHGGPGWGSAGGSGNTTGCCLGGTMDISPLPAGRLMGPESLTAAEVAAYVVAAAVWAPSVHNTQPWWFSADGQELRLHADARRQLRVADPRGREMMISCGAALFT